MSHITNNVKSKRKEILVFGGAPDINDFPFDKIPDDVVTYGVNFIWMKYVPNYIFFIDDVVSKAILAKNPNHFNNTTILIPQKRQHNPHTRKLIGSKVKTRIVGGIKLRNSISAVLEYIINIHRNELITIYIAGVQCVFDPKNHHFTKDIKTYWGKRASTTSAALSWYKPRFKILYDTIRIMVNKNKNVEFINITPNSKLKNIMISKSPEQILLRDHPPPTTLVNNSA